MRLCILPQTPTIRALLNWREITAMLITSVTLSVLHFVVWEQTHGGLVIGYAGFLLSVLVGQILCMYVRRGAIHFALHAPVSRQAHAILVLGAVLVIGMATIMAFSAPAVLTGTVLVSLTLIALGKIFLRHTVAKLLYTVYIRVILTQCILYFAVSAVLFAGFFTGRIDIDTPSLGTFASEVFVLASLPYPYVRMVVDLLSERVLSERDGSKERT